MSREIMQQAVFALSDLIYDFPDDGDVDALANAKAVMKSLEAELAKPEQSKYSDIVSDGELDPRNKFDVQPKPKFVWLTDDEEWDLVQKYGDDINAYMYVRDVKLKEINCG